MSTTDMPTTVTPAPTVIWATYTVDSTYAYSYSVGGTYGGGNIAAPATDPATIYMPTWDPNAPVDYSHQTAQLVAICVLLGLTVLIMIGRTWYRGRKLKHWRADDKWIMASLVLTIFPLWVCQLGAFASGSGLKAANIKPSWDYRHFVFSWGWAVSYLVSAMVRVSVCACLLDILPHSFTKMRRFTYALCAVLLATAVALGLIWLFQYRPFLANFLYSVAATYWMPMDPPRYFWCAMNVPIDIGIISIPYMIITKTKLKPHERRIIFLVFAAQGMGTVVSAFGIYGVWLNRASLTQEIMWNESIWLVLMDAEIFAYTLGATFPMFSRYFILKAAPSESQQHSDQHSWFKAAASSFSRFSPFTRSQNTHNAGSYDEMSGGNTRRKSSGRKPSSESSEKLDAIPMGQVNDRSPQSDDIEWGKTIWIQTDVSLDSATRGNSEEYVAPQSVPKPPKLYSAFAQ